MSDTSKEEINVQKNTDVEKEIVCNSGIESLETDEKSRTDYYDSSYEYKDFVESSEDNDGENRNLEEDKKVSTFSICIAIIKSIIGVGIINLPYIFKTLGVILGSCIMLLSMFISINSVIFLMKCKEYTKKYSYSTYAKLTYGTFGSVYLKMIVVLKTLCSCCLRLKAFGTVSQSMITTFIKEHSEEFFLQKNFFVVLISLILLPLMFKNDVSGLKRFNFLGVVASFFFVISLLIVCIYKFFEGELEPLNTRMLWPTVGFSQIFISITASFDTFSFHINTFPIYLTMKKRTTKNMIKSSIKGITITSCLYFLTGLSGFVMFRDNLQKDVFQNFRNDVIFYSKKNIFISSLLYLSLFAFFISALLSFPLIFFSLKNNLFNLIHLLQKIISGKKRKSINKQEQELVYRSFGKKNQDNSHGSKKMMTLICYCTVCLFTIYVPGVMTFSSLTGSTFGNFINIFAPALFLLKFSKANYFSYEKNTAIFSIIVSIITTTWFVTVQIKQKFQFI